jgi:NADH dehydrogenase
MRASVLVLGGGFAGLAAAGELARWSRRGGVDLSVGLIDRSARAVFSPLLPDLITARAGERAMTHPLGEHCCRLGVEFVRAELRGFDPATRHAETDYGTFDADAVIVCLGCETNYFGDDQLAARAPGLKTVQEGQGIRERALALLQEEAGGRPALLVVGGGYTGFEVASQLAVLASGALGRPYGELPDACPIVIVEKSGEVLRPCSPKVRAWARDLIDGFGVQVRTGVSVESCEADGTVRLSDGAEFGWALVVWCAGVAPGPPVAGLDVGKVAGGRLAVDEYLRLPDAEGVYAAGDVAGPVPPGKERPIRPSVQFSLLGGRCAAGNAVRGLLGRPLRPFAPRDPGYVVPLAPGKAAGEVLGMSLHGRLPNLLHYVMCGLRSWSWDMRRALLADLWHARKHED